MFHQPFYYPKPMDAHVWILGAPIQLMGCFEVYPIFLLGLFSKYECWVTNLIMPLYHFVFGLSLAFLYHEVSYYYEM
jgi:hypothetical protein